VTADGSEALYAGLRRGGVDFAVHIPDSVLSGVSRRLAGDPEVITLVCSREDEGVAMAAGAFIAGRVPVVVMEGSGLGYSALILARAQIQRTPTLLLASHTPALGERFDFHGATRLAAAGVLAGLGIPTVTVYSVDQAALFAEQAVVTVLGQKTCVALLVPPYITAPAPAPGPR
jgi:sulfopyruvate decarboxylase subunit alpha